MKFCSIESEEEQRQKEALTGAGQFYHTFNIVSFVI